MESRSDKITIIGGGVNGICSAYFLSKEGFEVEVIDPSFSGDGTSYGNAGMIVPSHFIPMASPGIISKGLSMMLDSSSPFYIKPRLDFGLAQWLWRFTRSCSIENVERSQRLIWEYNELSKKIYKDISELENFDFGFQEQGLLMLYKNDKSKKEEIEVAERAISLGLKVEVLDQDGVQKLNPNCEVDVLGGVYYPDDAHLYSNLFMRHLITFLKEQGVKFIEARVVGGEILSGTVKSLSLENGDLHPISQVLICAGAWTGKIAKMLGIKLLLEDGKGYSISKRDMTNKPTIPSILTDEKVAITPMASDLRITGTLEISGISKKINRKRVDAFLNAVPKYYPNINVGNSNDEDIWTGYRPLSFDGVPYLGRPRSLKNTVIASGHGMMGMSLGPATGKLVSDIFLGKKSDINLDLMRIDR